MPELLFYEGNFFQFQFESGHIFWGLTQSLKFIRLDVTTYPISNTSMLTRVKPLRESATKKRKRKKKKCRMDRPFLLTPTAGRREEEEAEEDQHRATRIVS